MSHIINQLLQIIVQFWDGASEYIYKIVFANGNKFYTLTCPKLWFRRQE